MRCNEAPPDEPRQERRAPGSVWFHAPRDADAWEALREHTGQPLEKVSKDTDRDFILTAGGAVEYGVVDEVITSRKRVMRAPPRVRFPHAGEEQPERTEEEPE